MTNKTLKYNNIEIEYLSTKKDDYDVDVSYFKLIGEDEKLKKILETLNKNSSKLFLPFWITDELDIILKVKSKWLKVLNDNTLVKNEKYNASRLELIPYEFVREVDGNDIEIKGYYLKLIVK